MGFDGGQFPLKREENAKRTREANLAKAKMMGAKGDVPGAEALFKAAVSVTPAMAQSITGAFGVSLGGEYLKWRRLELHRFITIQQQGWKRICATRLRKIKRNRGGRPPHHRTQ